MATGRSVSSFGFKKFRVRLRIFSWILLLAFNLLISSHSSLAEISYGLHCGSFVPSSGEIREKILPSGFMDFDCDYLLGGEKIFNLLKHSFYSRNNLRFRTRSLYKTEIDGIFRLEGRLIFQNGWSSFMNNRSFNDVGYLNTGIHYQVYNSFRPRLVFELQGFWSELSGDLCMVGLANLVRERLYEFSIVFKANYPSNSTILTSIISGTVHSLDSVDSPDYFDSVSMLAFVQRSYKYTLITKAESCCDSTEIADDPLSLTSNSICSTLHKVTGMEFRLKYDINCINCNPFDKNLGRSLKFMSINDIRCSDENKLRLYLGFSSKSIREDYRLPLVPGKSLVGEGMWDSKKNRLCIVLCRVVNSTDTFLNVDVEDCNMGLNLWFPAVMSLTNRSIIVGSLRNNMVNDSNYFEKINFQTKTQRNEMIESVSGLRYKYTRVNEVEHSCWNKEGRQTGKKYPDGHSKREMRLDFSLRNAQGIRGWGFLIPYAIGDYVQENGLLFETHVVNSLHKVHNISYRGSFRLFPTTERQMVPTPIKTSLALNVQTYISAEGVYNSQSGILCMIACRYLEMIPDGSMDCKMKINISFTSSNHKLQEHSKGILASLREETDSLYFQPLELSSVAEEKFSKTLLRIDLEIVMALFSLTLACICIGLQLLYMKKHMDHVPSISLMMLFVVTTGYLFPLVLNFEAFFPSNRNRLSVTLWSYGWIEINEVVVRLGTMVAFLLQFRLLQLAWTSRKGEGKNEWWVAEKKVLFICVPLYIFCMFVVHFLKPKTHKTLRPNLHLRGSLVHHSETTIWKNIPSLAGLITDAFLLPQILLNFFSETKTKALSPSYYIGFTVVRSLPHVYDIYRVHSYVPHFQYIYADLDGDFYSTVWDVTIPFMGSFLALLVHLQQRFGGTSILLPWRLTQKRDYEEVPQVALTELSSPPHS